MRRTTIPDALTFPSRRALGTNAAPRLLIVDADVQYRTFARVLLRNSRYVIDEAGDWETMTSRLSQYRYQVIIVDPNLGGLLCHDVGRLIRRRNPEARVLVWSILPQGVLHHYLEEIRGEFVSKHCGQGDLVDLVSPRQGSATPLRILRAPSPTSLPPASPLSIPPGSSR